MKFYSQHLEDLFIFLYFINKKRLDGIFCEVGAFNGVFISNTKFFEEHLSYRGVLIEPSHEQFRQLQLNRPNNDLYNYAVNYKFEEVDFIGESAMSGIEGLVADGNLGELSKFPKYKVNTAPMRYMLNKSNLSYIDLFFIDVEGFEDVVLETMDWSIECYLICIELDGRNGIKDNKCRKILNDQKFSLIWKMGVNEYWVNKNYSRINLLFDKELSVIRNPIFHNISKELFENIILEINQFPKIYMNDS